MFQIETYIGPEVNFVERQKNWEYSNVQYFGIRDKKSDNSHIF